MTSGDVELWLTSPGDLDDAGLAACLALLSPPEHARHLALHFERHRREHLATRALARGVLTRYRPTTTPASLAFAANRWGRPQLDPPGPPFFNLSNSQALIACAVADVEVGVDLEPLGRAADVLGLAPDVFSPREQAELEALPSSSQPGRALTLWTLKESYIKARGMGLALPLDRFSFSFDGDDIVFTAEPELDGDPGRWRFLLYDVRGHRLALCREGDGDVRAVWVHPLVSTRAPTSQPLALLASSSSSRGSPRG